jgi:hypothetical protein
MDRRNTRSYGAFDDPFLISMVSTFKDYWSPQSAKLSEMSRERFVANDPTPDLHGPTRASSYGQSPLTNIEGNT